MQVVSGALQTLSCADILYLIEILLKGAESQGQYDALVAAFSSTPEILACLNAPETEYPVVARAYASATASAASGGGGSFAGADANAGASSGGGGGSFAGPGSDAGTSSGGGDTSAIATADALAGAFP